MSESENWSHIVMRISEGMPEFKKMVDESNGVAITLDYSAFGTQYGDCIMLGVAITYATRLGYNVNIVGKKSA